MGIHDDSYPPASEGTHRKDWGESWENIPRYRAWERGRIALQERLEALPRSSPAPLLQNKSLQLLWGEGTKH